MGSVYRLLFQKSYLYTPRSSPTQNVLRLLRRNYHLIRNNGEGILGRRASAIVTNESHSQLLAKICGVNFMDVIRYKYVRRETRVCLDISNLNGPIIEEPEDGEEPDDEEEAAAEMEEEEEDHINAPGIKHLEEDDSDLERLAEMGVVEQRSIWIIEPEEEEEENTPANEVEEEENTPANEEEENKPANEVEEEENTPANDFDLDLEDY